MTNTMHCGSSVRLRLRRPPSICRTQDRDHSGRRTPRWRGITTLHEARAAGCEVVLASDNTRDQFYAYGDLDMLEVFTQVGFFC